MKMVCVLAARKADDQGRAPDGLSCMVGQHSLAVVGLPATAVPRDVQHGSFGRPSVAQAEVHRIVGAHEQGEAAKKAQLDHLLRHLPERLRQSGAFRMDVSPPLLHSMSGIPRVKAGKPEEP